MPSGTTMLGIMKHLAWDERRWFRHYLMIEETARHAGHLDILRELTDGRTGD